MDVPSNMSDGRGKIDWAMDIQRLRDDATRRAASRPRLPFDGIVIDADVHGVRVRRYSPLHYHRREVAYFAHGGYGLFGTLDLQDGYCRLLAQGLGCDVVAVDYRLAPEFTFNDAVQDLVTVVEATTGDAPCILTGDSAGGAISCAAVTSVMQATALLLTNPNLDLTLATFDGTAPEGPDVELARFAFTQWVRPNQLHEAPRLHEPHQPLPATFIAVGARDALLPEARALASNMQARGSRCDILKLPDVGHGFISDPTCAREVVQKMEAFLGDLASVVAGAHLGLADQAPRGSDN